MERFSNWRRPYFDENGYAWEATDPSPFSGKPKKGYRCYGWRCDHEYNLKLGKNTDIGCFTYINASYGVEIGDNVQIGSQCSIYSDNTENNTHGKVIIGKNSLIGSHCLILPNTIIPPNSKIRAFSTITPEYFKEMDKWLMS